MFLAVAMSTVLALTGQGTDVTLAEVLSGRAIPLEMASSAIPSDYLAVEMQSSGSGGGMESLVTSPFMMLGMMMGGQEGEAGGPPPDAISALTAVWTNGRILRVDGQAYYVTYGFSLAKAVDSNEPPKTLQLKLVRVDTVASIRPLGRISPDLSRLAPPRVADIPPAAPSLVESHGGGTFELTGPTPVFLTQTEAVSGTGRASRQAAMKALLLRTDMVLGENKNVFPYVQSTASMYGVLAGSRSSAMPPMDFYRLAACPRDGVRFVFNMSLAGVDAGSLPNGASLPVWYEQDPDLDGNRVVGLLNGSARLVNTSEWSANYTTLLRKTYKKAAGAKPLAADYGVSGVPPWLR